MGEYSVLIGGKAGEGINTAGLSIAALFSRLGYRTYMYFDYPSLIRGGHNYAIIRASENTSLFCIGAASAFGYLLAYFRVNEMVLQMMKNMNFTTSSYTIFVIGLFFVVGMFMDATPAIYIFVPIVVPIGVALGMHPVHLALIVCLVLALGMITPPYGLCLLIACQIAKIDPKEALRDTFVQLIGVTIVLLLIIFWEDFVLFLPRLLVPKYL